MGRLAQSAEPEKLSRDYKPQAIDYIISVLDEADRARLLTYLNRPPEVMNARRVAEEIIEKCVPEYPEIAFFADLKGPDAAVRTWRNRNNG